LQEAIEQRFEVDPSGLIMRLNHYSPWKDHIYELEKELSVDKPILFCLVSALRESILHSQLQQHCLLDMLLSCCSCCSCCCCGCAYTCMCAVQYEDDREKKWRIQAVSVGTGSFCNRR